MKKIRKLILLVIVGVLVLLTASVWLIFSLRAKPYERERVDEEETVSSYRVLLLGRDESAGLCDVMMLMYLDRESGRATVAQIPRDTYMRVDGSTYSKINGALGASGDERELCALLSETLGVSIPYYVVLDTDAFGKIVDALGGVRVNLPYDMDYEDPASGLSIHLPAGEQLLNGMTAEHFVRYRSGYVRGDLGRMDAQKIFLTALFTQLRENMTLSQLCSLARTWITDARTNLTLWDLFWLARGLMSVSLENVTMVTLPGEDLRSDRSGAWYYVLSKKGCVDVFNDLLGAQVDEQSFDIQRRFCYDADADFVRIYESEKDAEPYDAANIEENGIQIPTIH